MGEPDHILRSQQGHRGGAHAEDDTSKQEGSLQNFMEQFSDYIIFDYKNGWYIKVALIKLYYPKSIFDSNDKPTSLIDDENKDEDEVNIQ